MYVAWYWRHQSKSEFLAAIRTQKGQTKPELEKEFAYAAARFYLLRSASPNTICKGGWLTTEQHFPLP